MPTSNPSADALGPDETSTNTPTFEKQPRA